MKGIQVQAGDHKIIFKDDLPKPTPNDSQLLIKVLASPINPSDAMNASGKFPHTTFPRIPGRDFAGIVVEAPSSSPIAIGAEVYGTSGPTLSFTEDGAAAEFVVVPVDAVALKPKSISFAQAASVGTPFTAARLALQRAQAKSGETVLVIRSSGEVDLRKLYRLNHVLVGCNSVAMPAAEMAEALAEMGPWFDSGDLEAPRESGFTGVGIEDLAQAYEDTISGKGKGKKFILEFEK